MGYLDGGCSAWSEDARGDASQGTDVQTVQCTCSLHNVENCLTAQSRRGSASSSPQPMRDSCSRCASRTLGSSVVENRCRPFSILSLSKHRYPCRASCSPPRTGSSVRTVPRVFRQRCSRPAKPSQRRQSSCESQVITRLAAFHLIGLDECPGPLDRRPTS